MQCYIIVLILGLSLFSTDLVAFQLDTTVNEPTVFVFEIRAEIDPRTNRLTELALEEAQEINADLVIIDMNTYGGAVNDADEIRTRILEFDIPIYVFINKNAASAGALISIATDSIYMAPGASIGAATVVTQTGEAAPDKYQSYMRSIMRSTAEATGRDPNIAQGMVDENIEIEGITEEGEVITFSTSEALKFGFAEAEVNSLEELLAYLGLDDYNLVRYERSSTEEIISFFLNPFISGILILIIIGGIYFELQTPGVGFPILASVTALILYLIPYYLNGLAANWEIIAFFVGVVLIALEIFVIPGFGVAGISGLILTIGSLILVMLNNDFFDFSFVPSDEIFIAVSTTLAGMLGGIILMFWGGMRLVNTAVFKRIALETIQDRKEGYTSTFRTSSMVGKKGTTYTVLRPSGKIMIEDEIYDAYTRGDYIDRNTSIIVVDDSGASLKVKKSEDV
ncbi:MAG: NfeD family protein [Candidatus Cyclobacteriaceae bacterium M3_2C_046]